MLRHRLLITTRSLHAQPVFATLAAASALSLLAACGNSSTPAIPSPSVSVSVSVSPSISPSVSASASTAPVSPAPTASVTTAVAGPADCQSTHLALQAGQSEGAAGSTILTFILRNAGTSPCGLFGFPGVSFLNSSGAQLGAAATRHGTATPRFIVQPGQVASFQVQVGVAGCAPSSPQSTTIRVYPPNQLNALEAPAAYPICSAPSVTAVKSGITQ